MNGDRSFKCTEIDFVCLPVTEIDWYDHLHGKSGIGITAIRADGKVWFACADLDAHKITDLKID
jgi:hypothetical protein